MRKRYLVLLSAVMLAVSCQKSISDFSPSTNQGTGTTTSTTPGSESFEAVINGQKLSFTIFSATLLRSTMFHEKRMDIAAISSDGKKRVIITLGEETDTGNGISVKKYILNAFPEDDPSTPDVDESLTTQGFTTYSTALGNNNWLTNVYDENGSFTVTACDSSKTLVSGVFATSLVNMQDSTDKVAITAGKLTSIKYTVLN